MTMRDVQMAVVGSLFNLNRESVFLNVAGPVYGETDILVIRQSLWAIEIEVKLSVKDFKADFKKALGKFDYQRASKHDQLVNGCPTYVYGKLDKGTGKYKPGYVDYENRESHKCKNFFFAVPVEIESDVRGMLPEHCGLIVANGDRARVQVPAPDLPMARKYTAEELTRHYRNCYFKLWKRIRDDHRHGRAEIDDLPRETPADWKPEYAVEVEP